MELSYPLCRPHGPYAISQVARALDMARGCFYLQRRQARKDKDVITAIESWHEEDDTMWHRKLAILLKIGKNRVKRVMKKYAVTARPVKKQYVYPGKTSNTVPNKLLSAKETEDQEILFSDFFEVQLADRTKVRGCFALWKRTRHCLSIAFDYHMRADLVVSAMERLSFSAPEAIFHSDQGSQYGAVQTRQMLLEKGFERSMSRARTPTDNGYAERFVGLFKHAVARKMQYHALGDFLQAAERWVNFYNGIRPHEGLNMLSPDQYATAHDLPTLPYLPLF